jgi:hypothetical protein
MVHNLIEDVKNDDIDASAAVRSEQQKTSGDASNPLPIIVTSDDLKRYPKLGEIISYTAPVNMKIPAFIVKGAKKCSPSKLIATVTLPESGPADTMHSMESFDTSRPGTTRWDPKRQNGPSVELELKPLPTTVTTLLPCAAICVG